MPVFQSLEAYWPGIQVGTVREGGRFPVELAKQAHSEVKLKAGSLVASVLFLEGWFGDGRETE